MKFVKSDLAKKLIIILIALMIFNIAVPKQVNAAWNFSGILMKPITSIVLSFLMSIDVMVGLMMTLTDLAVDGVGGIVEDLTEASSETDVDALTVAGNAISKIFIGPDTIFSGGVELLDANIFGATAPSTNAFEDAIKNGSNFAGIIKRGIATTYVILRNICAMIMLAGLIFTGIRVLITSNNPSKKAAWLQLVYDWLVGMVLLIFSHVIMFGIFWVSDVITDVLAKSLIGFGGLNYTLVKTCLFSFDSATQIICLILLGYLIYLTIVFAVAYFKRLLWICVLIVIAPIVSIMYAFGSQTKQIYSKWIREYVTTVLVQPFHLIVYYTLVSVPLNMVSAGTLEYTGLQIFTIIYALGAISFIRPAEKYIRHLFGMDQGLVEKASYDSGKKTLTDTVKVVGTIGATAASAGLGTAFMGALKSGQFFKTAIGATRNLTSPVTNFLANKGIDTKIPNLLDTAENNVDKIFKNKKGGDYADNAPEEPATNKKGSKDDSNFIVSRDPFHDNDDMFENDITMSQPKGMDKMNESQLNEWLDNMGLEQGSEERADMEESLRSSGHGGPRDKWSEEQLQDELDKMGLERGSEERADYERSFREAGHGDLEDEEMPNSQPPAQPHKESMVEEYLQDISDKEVPGYSDKIDSTQQARANLKDRDMSNSINAGTVNINAGNISIRDNAHKEPTPNNKDPKEELKEGIKKETRDPKEYLKEEQGKDPSFIVSRDPFHDNDDMFDNDITMSSLNGMDKMNELELQDELDRMGLERGSEERADYEKSFREAGHGNSIDKETPNNIGASKETPNNISAGKETPNSINAGNVNINAGSITMHGNLGIEGKNRDNVVEVENEIDSTEQAEKKLEETNADNDGLIENAKNTNLEVIDMGEEEGPEKDGFLTRRLKDANAVVDLSRGESGVVDSIKKLSPDSMMGKMANDFLETDLGKAFEKFEQLGGIQQLHEGFHTIRGGFFDGAPPDDWKDTNNVMSERIKARNEQIKYDIVNNEQNVVNVINKLDLEKKLREQYKDKDKYPEARIKEMAKDKAKEKIKSVSEIYVPMGIKNPTIMLELEDDRKKYGMTAKEVVKERVKYEQFTVNPKNVAHLNQHFKVDNISSVTQAIPPAKEYYDNGYKDIGSMTRVHELTQLLNVNTEYGMKLDKVLAKKGSNINLKLDQRKDLTKEQKTNIKDFVNKNYINKETKW